MQRYLLYDKTQIMNIPLLDWLIFKEESIILVAIQLIHKKNS